MTYKIELKYITTSKKESVKGLRYPLSVDNDGGVFSTSFNEEAIKQGILQLIKTQKGERVMYPNFGTTLRSRLFSKLDEITKNEITAELKEVFKLYEPRIIIRNIRVGSPALDGLDEERSELLIQMLISFVETPQITETVQIFINAN